MKRLDHPAKLALRLVVGHSADETHNSWHKSFVSIRPLNALKFAGFPTLPYAKSSLGRETLLHTIVYGFCGMWQRLVRESNRRCCDEGPNEGPSDLQMLAERST